MLDSSVQPLSNVNIANYPPGAVYGPHAMPTFAFVWILAGSAVWTLDDPATGTEVRYEMRPGMLAMTPRGARETYAWDQQTATSHAYIHFTIDAYLPDDRTCPQLLVMSQHGPVAALCAYLIALGRLPGPDVRQLTGQVLGLLIEIFVRGPLLPTPARSPTIADRALAYVRVRWDTRGVGIVSLPEIARELAISTGHLSRSFSAQYGLGLSEALEIVRLGRVAIALQRSDLTLAALARDCGFADAYHLSRRFSRIYELPPAVFRRNRDYADPLVLLASRGLLPVWNAVFPTPT